MGLRVILKGQKHHQIYVHLFYALSYIWYIDYLFSFHSFLLPVHLFRMISKNWSGCMQKMVYNDDIDEEELFFYIIHLGKCMSLASLPVIGVFLVPLLLVLNIFHTLF